MSVRCVGIVGAGTMGQGIAITCSAAALDVRLCDRTPALAHSALVEIAEQLDHDIARWRRTEGEKRAILARVRASQQLDELAEADIIIEAVPDELQTKAGVFKLLDEHCPPDRVLATNTSALSVSEIANGTQHPERVIGMHFLQPVPTVPLVEVVRGFATSDQTFTAALDFVRLIGKTGVEVFESPGFITTRVIVPFLNEAMYTVMEGVASADSVDTSIRLGYGLPVGPLGLADRIGLDEVAKWMQLLFDELGELKYRPCPLLRKMIRAGHLGVKTGRGFFHYGEDGRRLSTPRSEPAS
jgi:3-hydroxybutyryl-CoA dehydrogenase